MTASVGLAGAGAASAASPALHIANGSKWTMELNGAACGVETFTPTHKFTSDLFRDKGTWNGGGATMFMTWKKGADAGATFSGMFSKTPVKQYVGTFGGHLAGYTGQLVEGVVASFDGYAC